MRIVSIAILLTLLLVAVPVDAHPRRIGGTDRVTGLPACDVMAIALRNAGWPESLIPTVVAVSAAESNCARDAVYRTARELSVGPLQINLRAHRWVTYACATQYHCSARAALKIYRGLGLRPWVAYSTGAYRPYLRAATEAASRALWIAQMAALVKVRRSVP